MMKLYNQDLEEEDPIIQYRIEQDKERARFDQAMKRAERKELNQAFTNLCVNRLSKAHDFQALLEAKNWNTISKTIDY
jgi:hypothetical protein